MWPMCEHNIYNEFHPGPQGSFPRCEVHFWNFACEMEIFLKEECFVQFSIFWKNVTLAPLYNSFHRRWLPFNEQSSALLRTADILNYTFPFTQSSIYIFISIYLIILSHLFSLQFILIFIFIPNYTFPFIQSSKGRGQMDKLMRSWRRGLEIEFYNGLTWTPNIINYWSLP